MKRYLVTVTKLRRARGGQGGAGMNREVVAWLRTPEGEQWSRQRIERARWRDGDPSPASYLEAGLGPLVLVMPGMFSVKEQ